MKEIYTAAATLVALATYLATTINAGRARAKYGIKAPAVAGHEMFERAYRVQMNTLEQMVFFLPALWLYAVLVSDAGAAIAGLVWVAARILYMVTYMRDPKTRGPATGLAMLAQLWLFFGAVVGVLRTLL